MKKIVLLLLQALALPTDVNANKASPEMIWLSGQCIVLEDADPLF